MIRFKTDSNLYKLISDALLIKETPEPYGVIKTNNNLYLYIAWKDMSEALTRIQELNQLAEKMYVYDGQVYPTNNINTGGISVMPDGETPEKFCKKINCKFYVKCKVNQKPNSWGTSIPCKGMLRRVPGALTKRVEFNKVDMKIVLEMYDNGLFKENKDTILSEFFKRRLDNNDTSIWTKTDKLLTVTEEIINNWTIWKDVIGQKPSILEAKDSLYGQRQDICSKCEFSELDWRGKCEIGMVVLNCPLKDKIDVAGPTNQVFPPVISEYYQDHEKEINDALVFMQCRWPLTVNRKHHYLNYIDIKNKIIYTSNRTGNVQQKLSEAEFKEYMNKKSPELFKLTDIPIVAKVYTYLMTKMPTDPKFKGLTWFNNWGIHYPRTNGQTLGISLTEYGFIAYTVYRGNVTINTFNAQDIISTPEFLYKMPEFKKYLAEKIEKLTNGLIARNKVVKKI